jgi:uncharacterized membrane protein YfcA
VRPWLQAAARAGAVVLAGAAGVAGAAGFAAAGMAPLGLGAAAGFGSAVIGTVGPLVAPFFLAYGLVGGAYIGTEALSTVIMHVTKLVAYQHTAVIASGLALGPLMIVGSFAGKRIADRLPARVFVGVIEVVLLVTGRVVPDHG